MNSKNDTESYELLKSIYREIQEAAVNNEDNIAVNELALILGAKLDRLNDLLDFKRDGKGLNRVGVSEDSCALGGEE